MKGRIRGIATALMLVAGLACAGVAGAPPKVDVFTPQGEAKGVRQVAVRFTEPMVAFGDPRLADPFNIKCEGEPERLKGRGRWADARNWIYDFEADLPAGQRCSFTLKPETKSLAGFALEGRGEWSFHTGGPAVISSRPHEGSDEVDEEQVFILALDAKPDPASLSDAWCQAAGVNERIPLKVLSEKETREVLEANKSTVFNLFQVYLKTRSEIPLAQFKIEDKRWRDLPVIAVRCAQRLPAGAKMNVVLGGGVKTQTGIARGKQQHLAFEVRPAFLVKLTCERANKDGGCLPVTPIIVSFNASVEREVAAGVRLKSADGKTYEPKLPANEKTLDRVRFEPPFPEKTRFTVELPRNFRDQAGREPENKSSFPLATGTDEAPPLAKFPGRFGILELHADPVLPVSVRNIEPALTVRAAEIPPNGKGIVGRTVRVDDETRIFQRYQDFTQRGHERRARKKNYEPRPGEISALQATDRPVPFELPRVSSDKALEVIGIPMKRPGFYIVELASPRLGRALHGEEKPYYVSTSVLVTNLSVHLKHGRESSLVWVTSLDKGKPVAGARVTVRDCSGHVHFQGTTDAQGIADARDAIPPRHSVPACDDFRDVLFAFARMGDDLSFTSSDWDQGITPWSFNMRTAGRPQSPLAIHTVFDRALFRAGETVSMKHVARMPVSSGFNLAEANTLPEVAEIEHLGSGQKFEVKLAFDKQGIAESTWRIPKEAKLGVYRLSWRTHYDLSSNGEFRVEAFRVPLMRAAIAAPKEPQVKPAAVKLDAAVNYLSGGPAAHLPVKVRSRIESRAVSFPDYSEFQFAGKPVKEGITTGAEEDLWLTFNPEEDAAAEPSQQAGPTTVRALTLDATGTASVTIDKLPVVDRPSSLLVEMEYSDPNGEILAASSRVPLHPSGVYVGIKPEGWAATKSAVRAQVVALDAAGKPLAGRAVSVDVYERKSYSHRRRIVGGFYAYESTTETKRIGSGCSGTTDARGFVFCTVKPRTNGEIVLVARAKDDAGRESQANASIWVRGSDDWWFEPANNDRIDLIAEKKRYEPGETAKLQVRMPFREATVLVTVEREGILWKQVVQLDAKSPVIEVPMLGSYGPNVFVSALALRGRVDPEVPGPYAWLKTLFYRVANWLGLVDEVPVERDTRPTGLVDLSKPSYKLGMTEIKVGHKDYALTVKVRPEREVFKVRETARVAIEVTDSEGKPAANGEIALAAVDEELLELMDNTSWNILDGVLGERPLEVFTATAQGQVIGKRHFGKKAVAAGGGGGRGGARELFDTLLLWKGRVPLDAQGRANVSIPLNDSLTGFRVVAVAHAGTAKFGHGAATVRTTQDLMLFSGLPPIVREQDDYTALFTLRNTTQQPLETRFAWTVRDAPFTEKKSSVVTQGEQTVPLAPNEAKLVSVPVKAPIGVERLYWEIVATGKDNARDRLRVTQKVNEVHPVRVYQATLAQLDKPLEFQVERPADAIPGRGGVRVDVMGTIGGELSAVREYFRRYPYTCLEQRASVAIGLTDPALWSAVAASLPNYLDRDGLARYFPIDALQGSDALTAYLVQIGHASGREWPEDSLSKMLGALEGFATGKIVRGSALPTADLTIRKLAAIEALSRHDRAKPAMLEPLSIDPALWPTSALIDWIGILRRVNVPRRDERLEEALGLLRGRMNFQGTVMTFSTERNDALWWLMISGDVNANRALLAVLDLPGWREDMGRLVRGTLSRQQRGRWNTTVANAWGTVALSHFAQAFEKVPAAGTTTVSLGDQSHSIKVAPGAQTRDVAWPSGRQQLSVSHKGAGAPWAIVQSRAALPLKAPISTGYAIKRTVTSVEQKDKAGYTRGDVYRVTLEIDAQSDMTWVVVDDPIPSGAMILGSGLGGDSASLTTGEKRAGWASPTYVERTQEAYRAYYQFVPKGSFKIEYTVRLNNPGRFDLPATRVEALYAPEMFGEVPNASVAVK